MAVRQRPGHLRLRAGGAPMTTAVRTCRLVPALLAMLLGVALLSVLPGASQASAIGEPTDSAVTKSGSGAFKDLQVTVGQTKNLINQTVTVRWKGGVPTMPDTAQFGTNYLQIMQCWGDDPNGPDRSQCQFGATKGSTPGRGAWVTSRQVVTTIVDPKETLKLPTGNAFVPFWPVGHPAPAGPGDSDANDFFDSQVTNEVPLARTHGDGTGEVPFEIETVRQAAGLGCGDLITTNGVTTARPCWLVVVPRGSTEVDGSSHGGTNVFGDGLQSSPLSQTNWDNRIVFPLQFQPVGQVCPLGSPERRMVGNELMTNAISNWQPALCKGGGALYSYTQLSDDVVRGQVVGGTAPGLALATDPVSPDQAPSGQPLVYAPVGLSGLAIAFNVEHQPVPAGPEDAKLDGQQFTSMKLTPLLVAKLLTQSYRLAVNGPADALKNNPLGLTVDPDFLALNPDYKNFAFVTTPPDALVQLGSADVTTLLWNWVISDPDARAFLSGTPEGGMVINPLNKGLQLPTSTFPRNDQSCGTTTDVVQIQICTLDVHPFTNDMHEAGRAVSRGDSLAQKNVYDPVSKQPVPKKVDRQNPGQRALLAVVDTATAAQYDLPTAQLRNAAGQFVAPTTQSLQAAAAAMKTSAVPGVLAANPGATDPAAYPLAALSYTIASPTTLDPAAGKDYATFVRYAAGPGQQPGLNPGQLPPGLAPLPDALKAQAMKAADAIEAQAKAPPSAPAQQPLAAVAGGSTGGSNGLAGASQASAASGGGTGSSPSGATSPAAGGSTSQPPSVTQQLPVAVRRTPPLPAPAVGAVLLTVLICGALAATSSPVLQSPAARRWLAVVRRLVRREVRSTEQ